MVFRSIGGACISSNKGLSSVGCDSLNLLDFSVQLLLQERRLNFQNQIDLGQIRNPPASLNILGYPKVTIDG